jgi:3',5'-cyclic AMP phosphodiesterase CpdA
VFLFFLPKQRQCFFLFLVLAALHSLHDQIKRTDVPDGDVLIHCGDFTNKGKLDEIRAFDEWLGTFPHPIKLVIAGNHELGSPFQQFDPKQANTQLKNAQYVDSELVSSSPPHEAVDRS